MAGFSIIAKLGLDSSKFSSAMSGVKGKVKEFGTAINTLVKAGCVAAGLAITALAVKGLKDFVDFDEGMREVFTLLPDATEDMKGQMMDDMRELATTMGVDLMDATNALYQAISAGVDPDNAITFLDDASRLAIAGVTDLETAVSALTTIMNGYGLEAGSAQKISDMLFTAVKGGVTTIDELSANIGKVTPIAAELGVTFDEVGAMFSTMTSTLGAGKTAEAGTKITAMLSELSKEGQKASDAFKDLSGVGFRDFLADGGSVNDALQMMSTHAEKNEISLSDMFSSLEAGQGALILAADNGAKLTEELEAQAKAAGSSNAAFEEMEKSVARQMAKLGAQVTEVGLKLGEALLPVATSIMPMLSAAFEMFLPILGATSGASNTAAGGMTAILSAAEFLIKGVLHMVNVFGMWGDILSYVGKQIATFVKVIMDFGKAALKPIVDLVSGVGAAFKALGEILSNPKDAEKGIEKLKKAQEDMGKAMEGIGDRFVKAWDDNLNGFRNNNKQFVNDMAVRGKMFKDVWNMNLAAAARAKIANQGAVQPLIAGAVAAGQINAGLKGARREGGPLAQRMKMVKAELEGAQKWAQKCKQAQVEWNDAAEKGQDFHKGMVGILQKLLAQDKLRVNEIRELNRMLKQQKDLEQEMTDVSEKGYNWLHLQKIQVEEIARHAKRHIKDIRPLAGYYKEINDRIARADANMANAAFMANMFAAAGNKARNNWKGVAPRANELQEVLSLISSLQMELEGLEAKGGDPEQIEKVKVKLGEVLEKQKEINVEAGKHPMFEGGEMNPKAGDFQIFKDMDTKLGQIDEKLGGFFVNQ